MIYAICAQNTLFPIIQNAWLSLGLLKGPYKNRCCTHFLIEGPDVLFNKTRRFGHKRGCFCPSYQTVIYRTLTEETSKLWCSTKNADLDAELSSIFCPNDFIAG